MEYAVKPLLFSIVTVVFNGEKDIEQTIQSCIGQDYPNKEYIIIDGASKDNTTGIIKKFKSSISYFVSAPDNGIYDAMNKAIKVATGDWIIFMNCGDLFCDLNVLSSIVDAIKKNVDEPDVIYGNTLYRYKNTFLKTIPLPLDKIEREMVFCHQSCLVKVDLIKAQLFDIKYVHAADYCMMLNFYRQKKSFMYVDICISVFNQIDGNSLRNYIKSTKERFSLHKDYGSLNNAFILSKTLFRMTLGLIIKRIIPVKLKNFIFRRKYSARIV